MDSILILSDDKAIIQLIEKAVSGENHRITTMQPDEKTLDYSATMCNVPQKLDSWLRCDI